MNAGGFGSSRPFQIYARSSMTCIYQPMPFVLPTVQYSPTVFPSDLRSWRAGVGNDWIIGRRRRQFAAGAIAQKMIEGRLNLLFHGNGTAVAHIRMLKFRRDDIDTVRLGLLRGRQHAG